ncbi:hypothetical protein CDD81_1702 [Ophiocordyceps australis]|uniref:Condensin complex subunit 2 n=1 Tax=Ophiocordyceps australis TaxID=1399860 RepID=A0A2C5X7Y2_9HYPO|nr:hypothetical protein CDD81_1702 [Ophiocordyceps australis]
MPRVAQVPRAASARSVTGAQATASPAKSPVKIPLNDDAQERGQRMTCRKALHDKQIKQIRAAATPRKTAAQDGSESEACLAASATPRGGLDDDDDGLGASVTPMKRVPILANFEEWMKMATDNKINATNSWNFALIDYFHDMSLLKEGDGVNFQKASCTLDGCVKIYTNRVDSVATETGKLLSGLADSNSSKNKGRHGDAESDQEGDEELDQEGNVKKKSKNKHSRGSEATLAPSFSALQLKRFELEFTVDPLFKKASADFDEGGAKGLLLNHLMIDSQGRIVFDSSDDCADVAAPGKQDGHAAGDEAEHDDHAGEADEADEPQAEPQAESQAEPQTQAQARQVEGNSSQTQHGMAPRIDLRCLGRKFFAHLAQLDELDVCPSLKHFDLGDPLGSLKIPLLKAADDADRSGLFIDEDDAAKFDNQDDHGLGLGSFDMEDNETAFGQGGEAWARETAVVGTHERQEQEIEAQGEYVVAMAQATRRDSLHQDMLGFFDQALHKNWTSAQHWRIRKIKEGNKAPAEARRRRDKEAFEIDFGAPLQAQQADMVLTPAASASAICLPKKDWTCKSRNLVPDDKHFASSSLISLFLKPKARLTRRRHCLSHAPDAMDEAFWAKRQHSPPDDDAAPPPGDYDANFFHDDGLPFAASHDNDHGDLPPDPDAQAAVSQTLFPLAQPAAMGAFGSTLVTQTRRIRPDYVQYARKAKKVDVRRLKQELWKGMDFAGPASLDKSLRFTDVMDSLQAVYPKPVMDDISTSYCFISLLHLANEEGLVIEHTPDLTELHIKRDSTALVDPAH